MRLLANDLILAHQPFPILWRNTQIHFLPSQNTQSAQSYRVLWVLRLQQAQKNIAVDEGSIHLQATVAVNCFAGKTAVLPA